ncbi:MAG: hypothetical protein K8T25_19205, partial [Planctomycetia bacterium]|nr:hypothetical protein [Planctomycetia bacterium]
PCLGRRAVLASQAFPFSEGAFEEQIERTRLAYGTPDEIAHTPGRNLVEQRRNFFRNTGPEQWLAIADRFRMDYVVVATDHQADLGGIDACYQDASVAVYEVARLRWQFGPVSGPAPAPAPTAGHGRRMLLR